MVAGWHLRRERTGHETIRDHKRPNPWRATCSASPWPAPHGAVGSLLFPEGDVVRIRSIKPEFWTSESVGRLSRDARLLFIAMWSFADDSGKGRGAFPTMSGALFPFDPDALEKIPEWFAELEREGMVRRYVAKDGNTYYDIPKWLQHQKIEKPSRSRLPDFPEPSLNPPRTLPDISPPGPRILDLGSRKLDAAAVSPVGQGPTRARGEVAIGQQQQPTDLGKIPEGALLQAFGEVEDKAPQAVVASPTGRTFGDFRIAHPLIHVGPDERETWEAALRKCGWEPMDHAYRELVKTLDRTKGHKVLFGMLIEWVYDHYDDDDKPREASA